MRVAVTGAAGFVGRRVVSELLERGRLDGQPIDELVLVDQVPCNIASKSPVRLRHIVGDMRDSAVRVQMFEASLGGIFHLAATMTADAERNFDRGMSFNLHGFLDFLEDCRRHGKVRLVFSSSNAAFGGSLPDVVPDDIQQRPQSSYGVQKVISELLLDDYHRRGFLDGRGMRLPTVLLRPPTATRTLSSFMSAIVCEPLAGRPVVCPFPPETRIPVASAGAVARALVKVFEMPSEAIGPVRTLNISALTVTIGSMIAATERRIGPKAKELIEWRIDPEMTRIVQSMAGGMSSVRGLAAGVVADRDFDAIIDDYLATQTPVT